MGVTQIRKRSQFMANPPIIRDTEQERKVSKKTICMNATPSYYSSWSMHHYTPTPHILTTHLFTGWAVNLDNYQEENAMQLKLYGVGTHV